jgi:hypothetical protein
MCQTTPSTKKELFQRLREEYSDFIELINQVKSQGKHHEMVGNWTVFDILKHLAGWAKWRVIALEEYLKQGYVEYYPFAEHKKFSPKAQDEFNTKIVSERTGYSWDQVLKEIVDADERWIELLDGLNEDDIFVSTKYKSPGWKTLDKWVKIAYEHYKHHADIVNTTLL